MSAPSESHDGPPLTPQQAAVLEVHAASVALSAGAGCGKTRVLTERYLKYLDGPEPRPLASIVALTFTEKAARELRQRVRAACRRRLERGENPGYWRGVLRGLEAAPIGTFHQCCGMLLRRFALEAGLEPGFGILDATIAPSFLQEALGGCLRRWLAEGNDDLHELAVLFGLRSVREALADLVMDRAGRDYALWSECEPGSILEIWQGVWQRRVLPGLLERVQQAGTPVLDLVRQYECSHPTMKRRIAELNELMPGLRTVHDPLPLLDALNEAAKVQGGGTARHWPSEEVYEAVKDRCKAFRAALKDLRDLLGSLQHDGLPPARRAQQFARLAAEAVAAYEALKRERNLLDFDDLLLHARRLLNDGPESVRRRLASEVSVLLVDEFQDTDPIQAGILDRLAASDLLAGRVFLVGDTKQSIYRFRGAEPKLFGQYRDRFPDAGRKALTENFRSAPAIIDFVNVLFASTFPEPEHRLEPRSNRYAPYDGPAVWFLWAHEADGTDAVAAESDPESDESRSEAGARPGRNRGPNADQRRAVEARWLARLVAQQIAQRRPIWDERAGQIRPMHAGDVVFLFRSLNDVAAYENALVAEGLDYYVVGGTAFFTQQEVLDLINLLTTIEDPLDELALAGVLRSPFFGLSDEGLYWLARVGGGELATGLNRPDAWNDLSESDRACAHRAVTLLADWRARKDRDPIAGLLDRALSESGYEAALLAESLGPRKRANCRKLVRMAARFDRQPGLTLADFVARLRADLRKPPREEQAATTDEAGQAVRLMTIHQSKGLEFPVVVVPDLDRKPPQVGGRVNFDAELGLVVNGPADTSDQEANLGLVCFQAIEEAEERAEALRLLYVATTRAREQLVLSAGVAAEAKPTTPALELIAGRFDRATGACRSDLPDDQPIPRVSVIVSEPPPGERPGRRRRPRLLSVARAIERTAVGSESTSPKIGDVRLPRRLDLDPGQGLDPQAARTDRLMRAVLADPHGFDAGSIAEILARVVPRLTPRPAPEVMARVARRLGTWLLGPMAREIQGWTERRQATRWRLTWPPGPGVPRTAVLGTLDLAGRDPSGRWRLIHLALSEAPVARERLRLLLAARSLGVAPEAIGLAALVRLDPRGGMALQLEEVFDETTIDRALAVVCTPTVAASHPAR